MTQTNMDITTHLRIDACTLGRIESLLNENRNESDGLPGEKGHQEKMSGQTTQLRGINTQYESIG